MLLFSVAHSIRWEEEKRAKIYIGKKGEENMHKIVKITMQHNVKNGNVKVAERQMAVDCFFLIIHIQQQHFILWFQKAFLVSICSLPESHMVL